MGRDMRTYLKNFREQNKLSQQNVALKIGLSQQYYNYIEKGVRQKDMSLSVMERLAKVFNLSLETIIDAEKDYQKSLEELNRSVRN